jgi:hypothetical protein
VSELHGIAKTVYIAPYGIRLAVDSSRVDVLCIC